MLIRLSLPRRAHEAREVDRELLERGGAAQLLVGLVAAAAHLDLGELVRVAHLLRVVGVALGAALLGLEALELEPRALLGRLERLLALRAPFLCLEGERVPLLLEARRVALQPQLRQSCGGGCPQLWPWLRCTSHGRRRDERRS